jgi:hypothetical protein
MGLFKKKDTKHGFIIPENLISVKDAVFSPSGKYSLTVESYGTGEGHWNYTRGLVKGTDKLIADVVRNYSSFWYAFSQHSNGSEYLLCGEDYQGQTIINLDTGKRIDYLPEEAKKGHGFCWVTVHPSPDSKYLAVEGCVWACPYEIIIYDFSDPEILPYHQVEGFSMPYFEEYDSGWRDGSFVATGKQYIRKSDGKDVEDLDNWDGLLLEDGDTWNPELIETRDIEKVIWNP